MEQELLTELRNQFVSKEFTVIEKFGTTEIAKVGDTLIIKDIYPCPRSNIDYYFYGHNKRNKLNFKLKNLYFLSRVEAVR